MKSSGLIFALMLTACGSSTADNGPTNASNAPDDCRQESHELLAFNVGGTTSWQGPSSSYGRAPRDWPKERDWNPLRLTSAEDSSKSGRGSSIRGGTGVNPPQQCSDIHQAITGLGVGDYGTQSFRMLDLRLEHDVVDFAFPASKDALASFKATTEVKTKSRLILTFMQHRFDREGRVDPDAWLWRDEDQQTLDIETKCEKPFTVDLVWEQASEDNGFCRAAGAAFECPVFYARYTAEKCTFTAKNVSLKLPDGKSAKVSLGGTFDLPRDERYGTKGYVVSLDAVDLE
jgi:hypothetical protein